ncbi:sensor histidine kinase [Tumebacillus permanentifrigoris]|uniref:Circadian input-output histidine kinase CikA n=1 Tax=Tumebacillus permanentifrigoris TaxID=378543 RepID=A0A316DVX9_9BACL|nr:ATP-binding protein [Tumebacillus permanentifrigoris]PWK13505.1 signal transduction histidine kinase [Tumebacillus permanentifrigoris]
MNVRRWRRALWLFIPLHTGCFGLWLWLWQADDTVWLAQVHWIVIGSTIALTLMIVLQILTLFENDRLLKKLHHLNEMLESKVEKRTSELSVKNAELTEALQVKDDFMAAISHELRTPMHGILGYIELIELGEDGPISDELRADLQVIRRSANRLLRLIEDILSFSKVQNGKEQLRFEDVQIDELMEQIHEEMQVFADEKSVVFVLHLPDPVGTVRTDPIKVEQILVNLVNNAIKFTDTGHVMITARRLPRALELSVEDTGIGIERGHYDYIFEPFTQVDGGTTRKYNGTGLGLAIVRNLVTLLRGEVRLESEPGKGSRFLVRIPIER